VDLSNANAPVGQLVIGIKIHVGVRTQGQPQRDDIASDDQVDHGSHLTYQRLNEAARVGVQGIVAGFSDGASMILGVAV
jgi:hypothetical protein